MTAGLVRTVLGDIEPGELGRTMTHEHLLIGFSRWAREAGVTPEPEPIMVTLENRAEIARHGTAFDHRIDSVDEAIAETRLYADAGGGTIVDATNPDLSRDPEALRAISEATGVHVVMGAGHYVNEHHPLDMDERSEEQLFEEFVGDVTEGADGTAIRSGIIGEIGCHYPLHPNEEKTLRAATRASLATGAALLIHPGRDPRSPIELMRVVIEAGGSADRTIVGHLDRTIFEDEQLVELAETGCYVEFDLFGQESSFYLHAPIDMPNDATRVDHLRHLIERGFGDRLLVAQDICRKTALCTYGGTGYGHILRNVVPLMERKGMSAAEIDAILIVNPARILAMVEPS
jgi:phosphotriesterase-related protein